MEFRKNDLVTLEIEDCGIDGEGIGKPMASPFLSRTQ